MASWCVRRNLGNLSVLIGVLGISGLCASAVANSQAIIKEVDSTIELEIAATTRAPVIDATVTALRVGVHPDKTRIVLDVSNQTDLGYEVSADGRAVFIDLPSTEWQSWVF